MFFIIISFYSEGSVIAELQNLYDLSSSATSDSVGKKIDEAISENQIQDATNFTRTSEAEFDLFSFSFFEQFNNFKH